MIFPTRTKLRKGKSVKAVAHFSATQSTQGQIVMSKASNVQFANGIAYAGAFMQKDAGVLQYLPIIDGEQVRLKSVGVTMGIRTFTQFANCPKVVYTMDVNQNIMVISGNNATYQLYGGNPKKIFDGAFDSLVTCQSRVLGLKGNRVYLTSPTEMTFAQNLWVDLPTDCVALVNNGEVYAVGNDVYKLQIDGDESHLKITKICANVGVVQGDTVCAYGNKILFTANGKIMSLQHGSLKVVSDVNATPVCATMHNGLYYLSCQSDDHSTITAYNTNSGKVVSLHHVSAKNIHSNGYSLLVSDGIDGYELASKSQKSYWVSQPINFDNQPTIKHLHRLVIQTATDVEVHINADTKRIYHVKGKDVPQSLLIVGHGKDITVELHSNTTMCVKELSITARPSEVSL